MHDTHEIGSMDGKLDGQPQREIRIFDYGLFAPRETGHGIAFTHTAPAPASGVTRNRAIAEPLHVSLRKSSFRSKGGVIHCAAA
jgi:hypothetical protein